MKNEALTLLRQDIQPICSSKQQLHELGSLIIISNTDKLKEKMNWLGSCNESRKLVFQNILDVCQSASDFFLPHQRLEKLLQQSQQYQLSQCQFHNVNYDLSNFSFLQQHNCKYNDIAFKNVLSYPEHTSEILHLKFSPNGKFLISIDQEKSLVIWRFLDISILQKVKKKKRIHIKTVNCICWNQQSTLFATVSFDHFIKIWDTCGDLFKVIEEPHAKFITSLVFHPEQSQIIGGGYSKQIICWDYINGTMSYKFHSQMIQALHITSDAQLLLAVTSYVQKVIIYNVQSHKEVNTIKECSQIVYSVLSSNNQHLLLNIKCKVPELHLWDIRKCCLLNRFTGFSQLTQPFRCSFGYEGQQMIAIGSQDCKLFIWHISNSKPLAIIDNQNQPVSQIVVWHPLKNNIIISSADDCSIAQWSHQGDKDQTSKSRFFNFFLNSLRKAKKYLNESIQKTDDYQLSDIQLSGEEEEQEEGHNQSQSSSNPSDIEISNEGAESQESS